MRFYSTLDYIIRALDVDIEGDHEVHNSDERKIRNRILRRRAPKLPERSGSIQADYVARGRTTLDGLVRRPPRGT